MNKISLVKGLGLLFLVGFFASCDKDFNTIGADIVDEAYFNLAKDVFEGVTAEDTITGPVQSNNLALNSLGIYNDPVFGVTTSHFVSQAELDQNDWGVTFNGHASVDSVWVYVPYFSTLKTTNNDGTREYQLNSVYNEDKKFRLKIYENGYFLGSYDPSAADGVQRFYSDDKNKVESNLLGADGNGASVANGQYLNNGPVAENEEFVISAKEKIIYKTNGNGLYVDSSGAVLFDQTNVSLRVIKERYAPGIWLNLNKDYFRKRILETSPQNLVNDNVFKTFFRGLYFQVEAINPGEGGLAVLDFSKGSIKMTYNMDNVKNSATPTPIRLRESLVFKLAGNTINFFDANYTLPNDSERLYLKGGNGSVAYINVFGEDADADGVPDKLEQLRANNWMINEASLTFYIDNVAMGQSGQVEPDRIYLFDAKNKSPLVDYSMDGSTNGTDPKKNKRRFGGIIEKESADGGRGIKYTIRLTNYLKSCIKTDSTNFRLGLAVSEDINTATNAYLKPVSGQRPSRIVPVSSVFCPLGTILHSPSSTNSDKKLKLEIYYTKPD